MIEEGMNLYNQRRYTSAVEVLEELIKGEDISIKERVEIMSALALNYFRLENMEKFNSLFDNIKKIRKDPTKFREKPSDLEMCVYACKALYYIKSGNLGESEKEKKIMRCLNFVFNNSTIFKYNSRFPNDHFEDLYLDRIDYFITSGENDLGDDVLFRDENAEFFPKTMLAIAIAIIKLGKNKQGAKLLNTMIKHHNNMRLWDREHADISFFYEKRATYYRSVLVLHEYLKLTEKAVGVLNNIIIGDDNDFICDLDLARMFHFISVFHKKQNISYALRIEKDRLSILKKNVNNVSKEELESCKNYIKSIEALQEELIGKINELQDMDI